MMALEKVKQIKRMQFFEDKRSVEQFISDWEMRLHGNAFEWLPLEMRAEELCKQFVKMGLMEEEKR